jgi:hypothetical protein
MSSPSPGNTFLSRHARRALLIVGFMLITAVFLMVFGILELRPRLHALILQRTEQILQERFESRVHFSDYEVSLFPQVRLTISGLVLQYKGRTDLPPLFEVNKISVYGNLTSMLREKPRISLVQLDGLQIHTPPRHTDGQPMFQGTGDNLAKMYPAFIQEVRADDVLIVIFQDNPDKPPSELPIHNLRLYDLSFDRPASFHAVLVNAVPPGDINATGQFGPWVADEPSDTSAMGDYTFENANLGTLKGLSGILSSKGSFSGPLNYLSVQGSTDTPDFALRTAANPMALHTDFSAVVDGTNGNTYLNRVTARFLHSTLVVSGKVVDLNRAVKSRTIVLNAVSRDARVEDLIRLAVKGQEPLMTGSVNLRTDIDIPERNSDLIDRLKLSGHFAIEDGQFTNPEVQQKVDSLSRRGQGHPKDFEISGIASGMNGDFMISDGSIDFSHLNFGVNGASVDLSGIYSVDDGTVDFHGKLSLKAKLSQTTTGPKSFFLKAIDPFFKGQNSGTVLPIKITGTRENPSFGLDRHGEASKSDLPAPKKSEY